MSYAAYNEIFDTFYNESNDSEFVPHSIKIQIYENNDLSLHTIRSNEGGTYDLEFSGRLPRLYPDHRTDPPGHRLRCFSAGRAPALRPGSGHGGGGESQHHAAGSDGAGAGRPGVFPMDGRPLRDRGPGTDRRSQAEPGQRPHPLLPDGHGPAGL